LPCSITNGELGGWDVCNSWYVHIPAFIHKDFTIFSDWIEPYKKGAIFYLDDNKIVGLIFWNLWGKVDQGRKVIREGKEYQTEDLKGLFTE